MILLDVITHERKNVDYEYMIGLTGMSKGNLESHKSKSKLISSLGCLLINDDLTGMEIKRIINRDYKRIPGIKNEIWKKTSLLSDEFEVSNLGRVRRLYKTKSSIILKYKKKVRNSRKQEIIVVSGKCRESGKKKEASVSRLVAEAFIEGYDDSKVVHRLDGNPYNDRVENLSILTRSELGSITAHKSKSKFIAKLDQITKEPVAFYTSARKAARHNKVSNQAISLAANKKKSFTNKEHGGKIIEVVAGFRWGYIDTDRIDYYLDEYPDVPIIE